MEKTAKTAYALPLTRDRLEMETQIQNEERLFRHRIEMEYIDYICPEITVEEYAALMRERENDRDALYYEALKWHLKRIRAAAHLYRHVDPTQTTVAEMMARLSALIAAHGETVEG